MEIGQIVAENLKLLRTARHLSLGQLAALSGVSKVMLSQIEKGETNPTINVLWKIASGLKVPYTALLDQPVQEFTVIKQSDLTAQESEDGSYKVYCFYPSTPHRNFELFQLELNPGCSTVSVGHTEKSLEYLLVTQGELTLTTKGAIHYLGQNDAIEFNASEEHTYLASGTQLLRAVVINYYPV